MIQTLTITNSAGDEFTVPEIQFQINDNQQFACLGIDFMEHGGYPSFQEAQEGVEDFYMGQLEDQGFPFHQQVINSLNKHGWDFDTYPNPEIILLTKTDK